MKALTLINDTTLLLPMVVSIITLRGQKLLGIHCVSYIIPKAILVSQVIAEK